MHILHCAPLARDSCLLKCRTPTGHMLTLSGFYFFLNFCADLLNCASLSWLCSWDLGCWSLFVWYTLLPTREELREKLVEYSIYMLFIPSFIDLLVQSWSPTPQNLLSGMSERHDTKGSVMLQRKDNVTQNPLRHLGVWGAQKAWLKTGPVQLFGDINVCWQHVATQKSIQLFMTSISPGQFSSNGSNGDKARARRLCRRENGSEGMIEGPSDSFLQALGAAISCCFISRWVEVIRGNKRGLRLAGRSDGYRHFSNHAAHNLHIVCEKRVILWQYDQRFNLSFSSRAAGAK